MKFFLIVAIFLSSMLMFKSISLADISDCTVTVSPQSVNTSTSTSVGVAITNNSESEYVNWVHITKPSADFTIVSASSSGWNIESQSADEVVFSGGSSIAPGGGSGTFGINITTGAQEASSADWGVSVSDGGGETVCSGSLGMSITAPSESDSTAPTISNVTVTDVDHDSFLVTWTTDEDSNSVVDYGTGDEYGSTKSDSANVTSHAITVDGLTKNTTYHFNVSSTDAASNSAETGDNTVTTAKDTVSSGTASVTSTSSTTTTSSSTVKPTPTPTPKPVDRVPPVITVETDFGKSFKEAPKILGKVTDNGGAASQNAGVEAIEYSTDGGKDWLPVDNVESPKKNSTKFDFTPVFFEDGNYQIKVRAKDLTGNIGTSKESTLVIDRLPPQVGGTLFSIGSQILSPNGKGEISGLVGMSQKITLSAVGGPTTMVLVSGDKSFPVQKNSDNGLWSSNLVFDKEGVYPLKAVAEDGAKNKTERDLGSVIVFKNGVVKDNVGPIENAVIKVFYRDPISNQFLLWNAEALSQNNPIYTDKSGNYQLLLSTGTYYLQVEASGFKSLKSSIFTLSKNTPIVANFELEKGLSIRLGSWVFTIPSFIQSYLALNPEANNESTNPFSALTNKEFPVVNLRSGDKIFSSLSLRGKMTVVTFLNTWMPPSSEQIAILDSLGSESEIQSVVVVSQESASSVDIFRKRGGYTTQIVADPDGELVLPLQLQTLPAHIFLDRKGVIKSMKVGVLTRGELIENLLN